MRGVRMTVAPATARATVRYLTAGLFLIGLVSVPAFGRDAPSTPLRVVGSTTIQPLIVDIAEEYRESSGITLDIRGGGSGAGLEALRVGTADVGTMSRSLTAEERAEFSYTTIGYDALAIIVNRDNPRGRVTTAELRDIYTGRVRIWDDAPQWAREIVLVSKQVGRGTLVVFEEYTGLVSPARDAAGVGDGEFIAEDAWEAGSNLDAILWVGGIPGAIGFVSIGAADRFIEVGHPIRKLTLNGVPAEVRSIESGAYPMVRELNLVYREGDEFALDLVRYMGSEAGRVAIRELGYVPTGASAPTEPSEGDSP
jgi:phosphate transport system substrate-binding protein